MLNRSQRASCPAPKMRIVLSSNHPSRPFVGRPPGTPGIPAPSVADFICGPHVVGSSPISNLTDAVGYVSENWRGRSGTLDSMPYLCCLGSADCALPRSKMCSVDLSDVTASVVPEGEKASEKMAAGSTPRRNSASLVQDGKDQRRMMVPCSRSGSGRGRAVASRAPE
jgi:hypothetical protein